MINCVYVEWEDHCSLRPIGGGAWSSALDQANKPCLIKTIGFVVKEDKKYLTICSCYDATDPAEVDTIKGVSLIIKSCIKKRKRVKL